MILTRARHQTTDLTAELESRGARVVHIPTIEILPPERWESLDRAVASLHTYDWLIFTSVNGVTHFLSRVERPDLDRQLSARLKVATVGPRTRQALEEVGIKVELQPAVFTSADLVEELVRFSGGHDKLKGLRILVPASNITRDIIRPALIRDGVIVDVVEAYRTSRPQIGKEELRASLEAAAADDIIFASPSAVTNLAVMLEVDSLAAALGGLQVICIGPATTEAARRYGLTVHFQPTQSTSEAVAAGLESVDPRR